METENKDQEMETASATLASGMHFVGEIDGKCPEISTDFALKHAHLP